MSLAQAGPETLDRASEKVVKVVKMVKVVINCCIYSVLQWFAYFCIRICMKCIGKPIGKQRFSSIHMKKVVMEIGFAL